MSNIFSPPTRFIDYTLALRPGECALLHLPEYLTEEDAARIARFLEALALPDSEATTIRASSEVRCTALDTNRPGQRCVLIFPHVGVPHRWADSKL